MENREELKRFMKALRADENLCKKVEEMARQMAESGRSGNGSDAMAKAAAELGYSVTAAELERAAASAEELDDNQLEGVSGGADAQDTRCQYVYLCYSQICVPGDDSNIECARYPWNAAEDEEFYGH